MALVLGCSDYPVGKTDRRHKNILFLVWYENNSMLSETPVKSFFIFIPLDVKLRYVITRINLLEICNVSISQNFPMFDTQGLILHFGLERYRVYAKF